MSKSIFITGPGFPIEGGTGVGIQYFGSQPSPHVFDFITALGTHEFKTISISGTQHQTVKRICLASFQREQLAYYSVRPLKFCDTILILIIPLNRRPSSISTLQRVRNRVWRNYSGGAGPEIFRLHVQKGCSEM